METAYQSKSAVYLRMGKSDKGDVHTSALKLRAGELLSVRPGSSFDCTIIATGSLVRSAMDIAKSSYPNATVWSIPFIKPIDRQQVISICQRSRVVVVLEEHSVFGGLGSVIAEIASEFAPTRVLRIGVCDRFSHYCGTYEYLLKEHGLNHEAIERKIRDYLKQSKACT